MKTKITILAACLVLAASGLRADPWTYSDQHFALAGDVTDDALTFTVTANWSRICMLDPADIIRMPNHSGWDMVFGGGVYWGDLESHERFNFHLGYGAGVFSLGGRVALTFTELNEPFSFTISDSDSAIYEGYEYTGFYSLSGQITPDGLGSASGTVSFTRSLVQPVALFAVTAEQVPDAVPTLWLCVGVLVAAGVARRKEVVA